jgi:hypothetical protein
MPNFIPVEAQKIVGSSEFTTKTDRGRRYFFGHCDW